MLVLSRKNGECVRIGQFIEVKVLEVGGGKVKLGFTAPAEVAIQRNEIRGDYPRPFTSWRCCSAVGEVCSL
jgi:carbon storage regulator CsrA